MRFLAALFVLLATPLFGQVQVDARLEKAQFIEGEPIFIVIDVTNVGDEPLQNSTCRGEFKFNVPESSRRVPPNIFGCFAGIGGLSGCGTESSAFMPGERISSRYLLKEYSLKPGKHTLVISGEAGFRWNFDLMTQPGGPLPISRHGKTEPVPGDAIKITLNFEILEGSQDDLKLAIAPYVSEANSPAANGDWLKQIQAQEAIIESAPPFLESLIAQFASADSAYIAGKAVEALGRIGSPESRSDLKKLYAQTENEQMRSFVVLTLARVGHSGESGFFADVLRRLSQNRLSDTKAATEIKGYAALGLGRIGGDPAVRRLKKALASADAEALPYIAMALGNTGSRSAVPVLISILGNNPAHNEVCIALCSLTHRQWCDGGEDDGALQKKSQMWWKKNKSVVRIYGTDQCPDLSALPPIQ